VDLEHARSIAEAEVARLGQGLVIAGVEEVPAGWVFYYNSARFLETNELTDALAGNAPVAVSRTDGAFIRTGTAHPLAHYIEQWDDSRARA